jgi:hypothetical protein
MGVIEQKIARFKQITGLGVSKNESFIAKIVQGKILLI